MMESPRGFLAKTIMITVCVFTSAYTSADDLPSEKIKICTTCHGVDGRGNESTDAPKLAGMESWYIRRQLQGFRQKFRGIHEQDEPGREMRPMAEFLNDQDIDRVIEWVATWPDVQLARTLEGNIEKGQKLYESCGACHGDKAQGIMAQNAPALAGQSAWYLVAALKKFKSGARGFDARDEYGQIMKTMSAVLADDIAITNVVAYIESIEPLKD